MFNNEDDFKKIFSQLNIDDKPNPGHCENLRRQMLSAFNETREQRIPQASSFQTLRRTIMKSPITKLAAAAAVIIVVVIGAYYLKPDDSATMVEIVPKQPTPTGPRLVALDIKLPKPMFEGTPQDVKVKYMEKPLGKPRPPFYAPAGTKNAAFGKPVTSTDEFPIIGELELITDGDKEGADGSFVELGPFPQHVTIDLEAEHNIYAIFVWHYHKEAWVYFDVVVQVASDPDFTANVTTVFNNDIDNSLGLGVGNDMHYTETAEGKLIDAKGALARYVRLHSKGSTGSDANHYIEVEIYGKAVK